MSEYGISCYNCDAQSPGRATEEEAQDAAGADGWVLGLAGSGQAHYACPDCAGSLFSAHPARSMGSELRRLECTGGGHSENG